MDQKQRKEMLRVQMNQQAELLTKQEDDELIISILDTCSALIVMAGEISPQVSKENQALLNVSCEEIVNGISSLYPSKNQLDSSEEAVFSELKKRTEQIIKKENELQQAKDQLKENQKTYDSLNGDLEQNQKKLEDLQKLTEQLENDLKTNFSEEKIQELEQKRFDIYEKIGNNNKILTDLNTELNRLNNEKEQIEDNINTVNQQISELPEINKQLYSDYHQLTTQFNELENAQEACSEEKQEALRKEIKVLIPKVTELQKEHEVLTNRLSQLKTQHTDYNQTNQTLTTNVIKLTKQGLEELKDILDDYNTVLGTTEQQANKLAESVLRLQELRDSLKSWFDFDETPLEAMMKSLKESDNQTLRSTLNVDQLPIAKQLLAETKQNLQRLDSLVRMSSQALQTDLRRIKERNKT